MFEVAGLSARYGDFKALTDLDLMVGKGETVALIGANGAGKSTFMKCVTGLLRSKTGQMRLSGVDIATAAPDAIARLGVALVPEGRMMFPSLTVEENLLMGSVVERPGTWTLQTVFELFPILKERRNQASTTLSGGQQQMVAIGRALMMNPVLLLCDELSLGLAPSIIDQIYTAFREIRREGLSILLVEQDVMRARSEAERVYCLLEGRVTLSGRSAELELDAITKAYFGA